MIAYILYPMSTLDPAAALTVELDALHAATHALSGAWAPRVETAQKSYLAAADPGVLRPVRHAHSLASIAWPRFEAKKRAVLLAFIKRERSGDKLTQ